MSHNISLAQSPALYIDMHNLVLPNWANELFDQKFEINVSVFIQQKMDKK